MKATNSFPDVSPRWATESHRGSGGPQRNTNWKLFGFSIATFSFFIILFLLWKVEMNLPLVGVFQELLTLPMMVAQLVLLVAIVKKVLHEQNRTIANLLALIISLATTILIAKSFIS